MGEWIKKGQRKNTLPLLCVFNFSLSSNLSVIKVSYRPYMNFARFKHQLKKKHISGVSQPGRIVTVCYFAS